MKIKTIMTIVKEYGVAWMIYRTLYAVKLRLLKCSCVFENLFEKKVSIKRTDIFSVPRLQLERFYNLLTEKERAEVIEKADEACKGIICGFSSVRLDFGNPVNWQLNPLTGESCNRKEKWFKIPDFDAKRGDIKVIWEASRFSHFIIFARAYMITKNLRYYEAFSKQLDDWVKANEYSFGANYKCGQECSIRMINLLLSASVFSNYALLTEQDLKNIEIVVDGSARKIESNFFYAYRCIKNNHTISELVGMIVGAWCQEDQRKLKKAYVLLNKVIKEQFTEDGGFCQNSFNYQRLALQMLEIVYAIEKKTKMFVDDEARARIYRSAKMLYQVQDEQSGDVPNYGSNDGALIFPLTVCDYRDFRPVINTIVAFETHSFIYSPGSWEEEYLWLSEEACERMSIEKRTSFFEKAGIYNYINDTTKLMINFQNLKKRPAQMDQLHLDLWVAGKNVFCDSGTYSYASQLGGELLTTLGHNTVYVDGKEQMRRRPPFLLYDWPVCKVLRLSENEFEGSMKTKTGYIHQRKVVYEAGGLGVIDKISGDFGAGYDVIFHTPYEVVVENDRYYIADNGQKLVEIQTTGEFSVQECYRSLYYLKKEKITRIHIRGKKEETITKIMILGGNQNG